ncbi:MAG: hypothetical protein IH948_05010, partial [Bacteroidetes bacterium]|nr:hypothetical protein [Bacteroidota bacterium]
TAATLEALQEVEKNPLPSSLNIKAYQASQYAAISKFLEGEKFKPIIEKVNYYENQQLIERLFSFTAIISNTGLIISIILGALAVLVAFNTIRLAIYNLRDEIGIMRLVRTEFVEEWIGRIHPGIAPLLVLGLGLVAEVLTGTTEGKPWYAVALQGLTNGGVAMELYDTVGKHFLKKKTT